MGIGAALAGVGAISSIAGGAIAGSAATDAAQVQADAAKYSAQIQGQIYNQTRNDLSPFVRAGQGALTNYASLLPGGLNLGSYSPSNVLSGDPSAGGQPAEDPNNPKMISGPDGISIPNPSYDPSKSVPVTPPFQLGPTTQSPFLTNLESYIPGSGVSPAAPLTALNSLTPGGSSPLNSALDAFIPGSGVSPNAALTALQGLTPGGNSPELAKLNSLLGIDSNPASAQKQTVDDLRTRYNDALKASGKSPDEFLNSTEGKAYQQERDQVISTLTDPTLLASFAKYGADDPAGKAANARIADLKTNPPPAAGDAASVQSALESTPGYQFVRDQGLKSVQNSYAAKGLGSSGAAIKGGADYASGLANATYEQRLNDYLNSYNSKYANAQNSYNAQYGNTLTDYSNKFTNALNATTLGSNIAQNTYGQQLGAAGNLLTLGGNAGAQTGQIGVQTGQNVGNSLTSGAAATAGGIVGSANAVSNSISNVGNSLLTGALYNNNSGGGGNTLFPGSYNPASALGTKPSGIYST